MRGSTNALEVLGIAMVQWRHPIDDSMLAIRAADVLAKRLESDIAIMADLSVKPLRDASEAILAVIRYEK